MTSYVPQTQNMRMTTDRPKRLEQDQLRSCHHHQTPYPTPRLRNNKGHRWEMRCENHSVKASKRENLPFGTSPPCPSPRHHPSEGPSVHHNYGILELRCKEEGQGIGRQQVEANCTSARKTHVQSLGRVTLAYAILRSMQKQSTPKQRHSDHTTKLQNEP